MSTRSPRRTRSSRSTARISCSIRWPISASPGTWAITPDETTNFRNYLAKGGFAIFDDFDGPWDWENFEACMASVLPGRHFERLELEDPVFQSFFHIKTLEMTAG